MGLQAISINELDIYRKRPNTVLVDLRTRDEYRMYHLEGAINIPYEEMETKKWNLPKNKSYIMYCERGGSSLLAAKELSREGYQVYSVIGGIQAQKEKHLN